MTEIIPATRGIVACPVERSIVEADITAMVGKYPTQTILRYEDPMHLTSLSIVKRLNTKSDAKKLTRKKGITQTRL